MNCPEELVPLIGRIMEMGILSARVAAKHGDAARCVVETEHIHNLPAMLHNYRAGEWYWYWHGQREGYIEQSEGLDLSGFEALWQKLEPLIAEHIAERG